MADLIQFREGDVLVAVRAADGEAAVSADAVTRLERSFAGALKPCRRIGDEFAAQIDGMTRVEGAELDVAFAFTAAGDLYIVEDQARAALTIRFTFKR